MLQPRTFRYINKNGFIHLILMFNFSHRSSIHIVKKNEDSLNNKLDILYIVAYLNHNTICMFQANIIF